MHAVLIHSFKSFHSSSLRFRISHMEIPPTNASGRPIHHRAGLGDPLPSYPPGLPILCAVAVAPHLPCARRSNQPIPPSPYLCILPIIQDADTIPPAYPL